MAKYTIYPCTNCMLLVLNETNKTEKIFPTNEARFQNKSWDWYLMAHDFLDYDWELSYDLLDVVIEPTEAEPIPQNFEEFLRMNQDDPAAVRRLEYLIANGR